LMNESRVSRDCGLDLSLNATLTAVAPVCSATRSLAEDTAGADAPSRGIRPRAAVIQAIVLAVPITPQVPACLEESACAKFDYRHGAGTHSRSQLGIDSRNILNVHLASSVGCPAAPTIGASADPTALE
jgi:hypothetical protein